MLTYRQMPVRARSWSLVPMIVAAVGSLAAMQEGPSLVEGKQLFFNARYREAAEMALECQPLNSDDELARDELRTSGLLFQLRALLEPREQKSPARELAFDRCGQCGELVAAFMTTARHGQQAARKRLQTNPNDETALF